MNTNGIHKKSVTFNLERILSIFIQYCIQRDPKSHHAPTHTSSLQYRLISKTKQLYKLILKMKMYNTKAMYYSNISITKIVPTYFGLSIQTPKNILIKPSCKKELMKL